MKIGKRNKYILCCVIIAALIIAIVLSLSLRKKDITDSGDVLTQKPSAEGKTTISVLVLSLIHI